MYLTSTGLPRDDWGSNLNTPWYIRKNNVYNIIYSNCGTNKSAKIRWNLEKIISLLHEISWSLIVSV